MIKYRPHRGGLIESMKKAKEFDNELQMKEYIVKEWNNCFSINDIVIDDKGEDDNRIGWKNVKHVCTKKFGKDDNIKKYGSPQCIGMCTFD